MSVTINEVLSTLRGGDPDGAVELCQTYLDGVGGPGVANSENDSLRAFIRDLDLWRQINLLVWEVDRRPRNARSWKLLGYAYMWAGLYLPVLLLAAEQAFLTSRAHESDENRKANLDEKIELCRRAWAGETEARSELAIGENAIARPFNDFPSCVPMPQAFIRMGICDRDELKVTVEALAPDLRRMAESREDGDEEWNENS